jgi:hypothetical protein
MPVQMSMMMEETKSKSKKKSVSRKMMAMEKEEILCDDEDGYDNGERAENEFA